MVLGTKSGLAFEVVETDNDEIRAIDEMLLKA
jgi:hypothetical protein